MRTHYIPALLTGIENPIKRCLIPGNKFGLYKGKYDPAWFTDLSIFHHPYMLVSYYYSGKIPDYRKTLRIQDDVQLMADSGGYSIFTQGGDISPVDVLRWQEKNSDIAFSLDLPPARSENTTRCSPGKVIYHNIDKFEENAEISRKNNIIFQENRTTDKLKIYNVIHGYNLETMNLWWDYVTPGIDFEGYATGAKPATNILLQALCIMFLYNKGVRKNIHLLGISGITVIPLIVWASQYIDNISFDSTSYGYGARTRAYVYPEKIRYYTHFGRKYATKKHPMSKIYCNCPICKDFDTPEYFIKSDITWPGMLLSLHNLWCVKQYVEELENAVGDKDKFFELVKQHTGNWSDKTIYGINFIEDCLKAGFDNTYKTYFVDDNLAKKRFKTKSLLC